jgi:hypothetical protein
MGALTLLQIGFSEYEEEEKEMANITKGLLLVTTSYVQHALAFFTCIFTCPGELNASCTCFPVACFSLKPPAAIIPYETCGSHYSPRTVFIHFNALMPSSAYVATGGALPSSIEL